MAAEDGSVPEQAGGLMASIVYLPSYPQLGAAGRDRMIAGLRAAAGAGPRLNGVPALTWPDPLPRRGPIG